MKNQFKNFQIVLFTLSFFFFFLSFYVTRNPVPAFDKSISLIIQKHSSPFLDKVMLGISLFGEIPYSFILVVIISGLFFIFKLKRESLFLLSISLSGLLILSIKLLFNRPRPTAADVRLVEINRFHSYPSGHVLSYILFFGFMLVIMHHRKDINHAVRRYISIFSGFLIFTIPFSRIYLGAHWFTDVLGGILLGLMCLLLLRYFYLKELRDVRF